MRYETTLEHRAGRLRLRTDDPVIHAQLTEVGEAELVHETERQKVYELPRDVAVFHFPELFGDTSAS